MGVFFVHILKSSVCLTLFYLCYRMLLSKETFHRFNRMALLSLLVFSFLIPFIEITVRKIPEMTQPFLLFEEAMEAVEVKQNDVLSETPKPLTWNTLIYLLYLSGILFFLIRHCWSMGRIARLLRTSRKKEMEDGITLYIHQAQIAPFSWMKLITISEKDLEKNGTIILAHEQAHIRNGHSWDLLLAQACVFLQWFNPAAWFLKKELQTIHEYEADEYVIGNGMDASTYQLSIIEKAVGTRLFTMANNFNHKLLNKRITMINKKKSNRWARLKYLFVLPIAALAVATFARPEVSVQFMSLNNKELYLNEMVVLGYVPEKTGQPIKGEETEPETVKKEIFNAAEEMPQFPGGMHEAMKFFGRHTKYPESALKAKIEGRVIVQFIIDKNGSVSDVKIMRSVSPELDAEAIRVVSMMPQWTPGKQKGKNAAMQLHLPITFRLETLDMEEENTI